tara:strand:- start:512 stop:697 length:186 start_codon:yes stop_codon:yes gene_type:complete
MKTYTINYNTTAGLIVSERYYTGLIKKMEKTKKIKKTKNYKKQMAEAIRQLTYNSVARELV